MWTKQARRSAPIALLVFAIAMTGHPEVASATTPLTVAYAGSMGAVMDKGLGPRFDSMHASTFQGMGHGAYGLARLLAARQQRADVFVSITAGPVEILQKAGLLGEAVPVASTQMVIAYSKHSHYAKALQASRHGGKPWYEVLQTPGLRFGRTDPAVDPQGRNIIFAMQLAERYYKQPGLAAKILGPVQNAKQVFAEPSLLSRLQSGQLDASSGYLSAAISQHLSYVPLPDEINLSNPAMIARWYSRAHFSIHQPNGKAVELAPQPLVFYAGVLKNAAHPRLAAQFVDFLRSAKGQELLSAYGYSKPKGHALWPAR